MEPNPPEGRLPATVGRGLDGKSVSQIGTQGKQDLILDPNLQSAHDLA